MPIRRYYIALAVLWVSLWSSYANAGEASQYNARTDRLAGLTQADLAILEGYLAAGPVALVEFSDDDAEHPDRFFAMVQTKLDWRDPSPPELVQASLARLGKKAEGCPHIKFHLNYPAIGLGGLPLEMVQPWVEALPDNVRVYRKSTGAYNRSQP